jgi:VanZ like family
MAGLFKKLFSYLILPVGWTLLTIVLLCLPGSAIPDAGFFGMEGFDNIDKVVHVILFGGIVLFWGLYMRYRRDQQRSAWKLIVLFISISITLGVVLEYIQFYFIPFRSFDKYDIVADSAGAIVAGMLLFFIYRAAKTANLNS